MSRIQTVLTNLFWKFAERLGYQVVTFVVSIVLARLLTPDIFGTIALVLVFISVLNLFVDSGFGNALIQKKNADDIDFSTVFFFNLAVCICLYCLMFYLAPFIAVFYDNIELVPVIRVISLTIIFAGVRNVQQAYVSRTLQFKRFFYSTLSATIVSAIIGVSMAYNGYGIWSLVAQQIANSLISTIVLWITVGWRPHFVFSLGRLKGLFSYGWKLFISGLIDTLFRQLRQLIIGKMYAPSDLGIYNRGEQFPSVIAVNVNSSIDSVLFPVMSREQDNPKSIKMMTRRAIMVSTYVMAPMMLGMAAMGTPLIRLVLTEKWLPCVPFLIVFCFTYMFMPIHTANLNAIKAMGRSDLFLKLEIAKKIVGLIALLSTMWISVMAMAYSLLFTNIVSQIINTWPNRKLLDYGYLEQLKDIVPEIAIAVIMGACVYPIQLIGMSDFITLCIQFFVGIVVYLLLSMVLKLEAYCYLVNVMKERFNK